MLPTDIFRSSALLIVLAVPWTLYGRQANTCRGNTQVGCLNGGAACTIGGQKGSCVDPDPKLPPGERTCECQALATPPPLQVGSTNVFTYHNDPQRTGWNATETILTPGNVKHGSFEFYPPLTLDDRIDAQPLVVGNVTMNGAAGEVVYVASEGNSVYAINPVKPGKILIKRSLGAPINLPLNCPDSGGNVGINSTPTIDLVSKTMYVIAYTTVGGKPTYQLHALDLGTLNDKPGSPVTVSASHTLANGSKISFDASVQRQRPGLLLADGNVYAGFGSFCDYTGTSRGWLLGWNAATLAPLAANELSDTAKAPSTYSACGNTPTCDLSSIWMSGYGIAAETPGDLFFVTGNGGDVYNGTTSIQESVVKVAPNLAAVHHIFTPTNFADLDKGDTDFGSGGVMVVPDQPGPMPLLAVAAGKQGDLFILNRSNLGRLSNQPSVKIGECWCGPSYYKGSDGVGRVVSSGGLQAQTWKINTAATPALQLEASAPTLLTSDQAGGFFTSISSNGTVANTAIIWAIGRRSASTKQVVLYAFNGTPSGGKLDELWTDIAGSWPTGGNANLVPTVANGRVYVASYQKLMIAGLTGQPPFPGEVTRSNLTLSAQQPVAPEDLKISGAIYWGTIKSVDGVRVSIELRTGKVLNADLSQAVKNGTTVNPVVGLHVMVNGAMGANGVLATRSMSRVKNPSGWGPDRVK